MNQIVKVSHLRAYLVGHITKETLMKLVPKVDFAWLEKNKETVFKLFDNYQNKQKEDIREVFDIKD